MAGASASTREITVVDASWAAGPDGGDGAFALMVVADDEERHDVEVSPAAATALQGLLAASSEWVDAGYAVLGVLDHQGEQWLITVPLKAPVAGRLPEPTKAVNRAHNGLRARAETGNARLKTRCAASPCAPGASRDHHRRPGSCSTSSTTAPPDPTSPPRGYPERLSAERVGPVAASQQSSRAAVFLGLSVDGRIARPDGDLEWLTSRAAAAGDAGFTPFMESVDAVVMGRKTYEAIASDEHWPYLDRPMHVISTTLAADEDPRITVHRSAQAAIDALQRDGHRRVYVDGGETIRWFLTAELVDELTLSHVPVLIGDGPSLFGPLSGDVHLEHVRTAVLDGGMVQTTYRVLGGPTRLAAE